MDQRFLRRGEEFSAGYRREQFEKALEAGTDYSLPRNQRIEDGVDFGTQGAPTLATPIPPDNKGYLLLQKMGWKIGTGLGKGEDGLTAPVGTDVSESANKMGLGRMQLEHDQIAAETTTRRQLAVEEQMNEDLQTTQSRLQRAEEREKVEAHVQEIKKSFYCGDCSKQYNSIAELEEHLSSYDHHHRKRLADLKKMEHERTREQRGKKETKRQAKEAARLEKQIAAARGMRSSGPAAAGGAAFPPPPGPPMPTGLPPPRPPLPIDNKPLPLPPGPPQSAPFAPAPPLPDQPPLPPDPPSQSQSQWSPAHASSGAWGAMNPTPQHSWSHQQSPAPPFPPEPTGGSLAAAGFSLALPGATAGTHGYSSNIVMADFRPAIPPQPRPTNAPAGLSLFLGGGGQNSGQQSHQLAFGNQAKSAGASKPKPKSSLSMFSASDDVDE